MPTQSIEHSVAVLRHKLTDVIITGSLRHGDVQVASLIVGVRARKEIASLGRNAARNQSELDEVVSMVADFLDGVQIDSSSLPLNIHNRTEFQKKVLATARRIPYGTTCSYGELAKLVESPGAVRAVASVMRRNPIALLIPCHRVIRSDGTIGGYCGSLTGEDVLLKKRLLAIEAQNTGLL